jgi:RNA polymerase sigma-70 factor (ECF subfamily)
MTWDIQELFRQYAAEITRSLRRRGHSVETAADLTQDAFVRLLGAAQRRPAEADNPRAYLHQVARNLAVDLQRRERLMPRSELSEIALNAIADPSPSAETVVYDRQRLAIVELALAELPERTRHAFELHRLGEKTLAEVGVEIGLSTTRTWGLIREAYRHIRARLHDA